MGKPVSVSNEVRAIQFNSLRLDHRADVGRWTPMYSQTAPHGLPYRCASSRAHPSSHTRSSSRHRSARRRSARCTFTAATKASALSDPGSHKRLSSPVLANGFVSRHCDRVSLPRPRFRTLPKVPIRTGQHPDYCQFAVCPVASEHSRDDGRLGRDDEDPRWREHMLERIFFLSWPALPQPRPVPLAKSATRSVARLSNSFTRDREILGFSRSPICRYEYLGTQDRYLTTTRSRALSLANQDMASE